MGKPQDGMQIGLFPSSPQHEFRPGDTLSFTLRVRNVSSKPFDQTVRDSEATLLTLGAGNRLRLQAGMGEAAPLRVAPGAETNVPGGAFHIRIQAPSAEPPAPTGTVVTLLPGAYTLECPLALWITDKNDPNRATGHRAKAGILKFTIVEDAKAVPPAAPPSTTSDVQWGETVNGLQGGISGGAISAAGRELPLTFFLRNTTGGPVAITYPDFQEYDWSPSVMDTQGKSRTVTHTFFTGLVGEVKRVLASGEIVPIGHTRLRLVRDAPPSAATDPVPTLAAEPSRYTVSLVDSVRYPGLDYFDVVLVSGSWTFDIPKL